MQGDESGKDLANKVERQWNSADPDGVVDVQGDESGAQLANRVERQWKTDDPKGTVDVTTDETGKQLANKTEQDWAGEDPWAVLETHTDQTGQQLAKETEQDWAGEDPWAVLELHTDKTGEQLADTTQLDWAGEDPWAVLGISTDKSGKQLADGTESAWKKDDPKGNLKVNTIAGTGVSSITSAGTIILKGIQAVSAVVNATAGKGVEKFGGSTGVMILKGIQAVSAIVNGKSGKGLKYKDGKWTTGTLADTSTKVNLKQGWTGAALHWLKLDDLSTTVKVFLNAAGNTWTRVKDFLKTLGINITFASGGYITSGGIAHQFASGGIMRTMGATMWNGIQKYASGTSRAHGTLFAAGEAGPEIVGHIGGRTEVLNKSQLAQVMFAAVENGMLSAISKVRFRMPAMATGSVMPYEVSAQIASSTAAIQTTLDTNNEDLIQTIISVIGSQTTTIVAALQASNRGGGNGQSLQEIINGLNRQALMYGASPIQGV